MKKIYIGDDCPTGEVSAAGMDEFCYAGCWRKCFVGYRAAKRFKKKLESKILAVQK